MNRRERKLMSKRLGIADYQRKLPREKKFKLMRENIIAGKKMHEDYVRKSKLTQEELQAEQETLKVYDLASKISSNEQITFVDAIEKAKTQIYEENKRFLEEK